MSKRIATMVEAQRLQKDRRSKDIEQFRKSAYVADVEEAKVRDLGRTPAGQLLKERYQAKFDKKLNEWLSGDPGDALRAVSVHAALNEIREFLASITPALKEPTEDE